jgi:DNA end-binding protein Ku
VEAGRFVTVTDEELAELAPRRSRDIELTRFVPRDAIDPARFVRTYFVMPGAEQSKAYRLFAEAMEASGRAALASFVMRGKSAAVAIFAERGLLRAVTLRFGDELRSPEEIAVPARPEPARVAEWKRKIEKLAQEALDERELAGEERADLLERAREKLARGEGVVRSPEREAGAKPAGEEAAGGDEPARGELIDLFTLIKQRIGESERKPPVKKRRQRARAAR